MSARELRMFDIQISHKFHSVDDAKKVVDALYNFIGYQAKQRKYFCQAFIGVSDLSSDSIVALKQEVQTIDALDNITEMSYDEFGNMVAVKDAFGHTI